MIYLKRGLVPDRLNRETHVGRFALKELDGARAHFLKHKKGPPGKRYAAYKHGDVRDAIHKQFLGKCIYCEKLIEVQRELNVEHYRPKGNITDKKEHPGYWWLAMEWNNLLPACANCNSATRQPIVKLGMTLDQIKSAVQRLRWVTRGKQNRFPTENNFWCEKEGAEKSERPLLLDPSITKPEPLIEWEIVGDGIYPVPKDGNIRAKTTIDILGLDRRDLGVARMLAIGGTPERRAWLESQLNAGDHEDMIDALTLEELDRFITMLSYRIADEQPHAAVARFFLRKLKERLNAAIT